MTRVGPIAALTLAFASAAMAADRIPWNEVPEPEQRLVRGHLDSPHWTYRVFAVLRLERYEGDEPTRWLVERAADEAWQVRCFTWWQAHRLGVTLDDALLAEETDPRVIRTALRHGGRIEPERLRRGVAKLLRGRQLDEVLLGLEMAAASDVDDLREDAAARIDRLLANMDDAVAIRIGRRLARVVGVAPPPRDVTAWHRWRHMQPSPLALLRPGVERPRLATRPATRIATVEAEAFSRLLDYVDGLRQRDLDVAIVADATMSMLPMINETRAGIESLMLFLDDIARRLQLSVIAYRDEDNPPVWQGHPFTNDVDAVRDFLFNLRITGGRDLPEAVLAGLTACGELDWNPRAQRQIILIGDARPHDDDEDDIITLLARIRDAGTIVHTVHVPQRIEDATLARMHPAGRDAYLREIDEHNARTRTAFAEIAQRGGGDAIILRHAEALVPSIMRFTIEETWWPVFDEFYALYLELCR